MIRLFLLAVSAALGAGCATAAGAAGGAPAAAPAADATVARETASKETAVTGSAADTDRRRALFGDLQSLIIEVSDEVLPSVVHVEAILKQNDRRQKVNGSGFVVDGAGHIVTNEHVVSKAEKVEVTLLGHKGKIPAEVVGTDKLTDLALIRIDPEVAALTPAVLGDDRELDVGEWVLAIGNPYGLDGTVSFGIVSAKGRNLEQDRLLNEFIQTDAMIDFGSSGGPLVNLRGEVIGVNSMGQGRGIGFTIPISTVKEVVTKLKGGGVRRGWLGVVVQPLDRDLAVYFGQPELEGVVVAQVIDDGPADRAGVQVGDILTRFGDRPLSAEDEKQLNEFRRIVAQTPAAEEVELALVRDGRRRTLAVETGAQPKVEGDEEETKYGFHVQEITTSLALRYRLKTDEGLIVSYVERGSPASEAGLEQGDVLASIDGQPVPTLDAFREVLDGLVGSERFLVRVQRGDAVYLSLIKPFGLQEGPE